MSEHDPLDALSQLMNAPVTPRRVFADELRARLLAELSAEQAQQEDEMPQLPPVTVPAAAFPAPEQHSRRTGIRHVLEIAAVLALIISLIAALMPDRAGNDQSPPTLDAVQGVPPVAMASPASEPPTGNADAIAWTAAPQGEPVSRTAGDPSYEQSIALDGVRIFRLVSTSLFEGLEALDTTTGQPLWQLPIRLGTDGMLETGNGHVFVLSEPAANATLTAVDQMTGEEVWSVALPIAAGAVVHAGDLVYLWDGEGTLVALSDTTGEQRGERAFTRTTEGGPAGMWYHARGVNDALVVVDGRVVVATANGIIAAVPADDIATAELLWQHEMNAAVVSVAATEGVVAALFFEDINFIGRLIGIDLTSGTVLWESASASDRGLQFPTAIPGGFAAASHPPYDPATPKPNEVELHAFDARNGQPMWITNGVVPRSTTSDGAVILGVARSTDRSQTIVAVASDTGSILGKLDFGKETEYQDFPSDTERLYAVDETNTLVAIDLDGLIDHLAGGQATSQESTGQPVNNSGWLIPGSSDTEARPELVIDEGRIFRIVQSDEQPVSLQAITAQTGTILWTQPVDWHGFSTPLNGFTTVGLAAGDGLVFVELVASSASTGDSVIVTAFDQVRGALAWTMELGQHTGPLAYHNGSLIFAGADQVISFDPVAPSERWRVSLDTGGQPILSPRTDLVVAGDTIVANASDGTITGIDAVTGKPIWREDIAEGTAWTDADPETLGFMDLDASGDRVVILGMHSSDSDGNPGATPDTGSINKWVKALDAATGEVLWTTDAAAGATSVIAAPDSVTIISLHDTATPSPETAGYPSTLTRLEFSTGASTDWTWSMEQDVRGGATLSPDGSLLFITTLSGQLFIIETSASSVAEPTTWFVGQQPIDGAPVVTDNFLLVTTRNGTLRAIPLATVLNV